NLFILRCPPPVWNMGTSDGCWEGVGCNGRLFGPADCRYQKLTRLGSGSGRPTLKNALIPTRSSKRNCISRKVSSSPTVECPQLRTTHRHHSLERVNGTDHPEQARPAIAGLKP